MLGFGFGEIALIVVLVIVVVGPERLPYLIRSAGRMYGQVRRASDELRRAFVLEADRADAEERYRKLEERRKQALESRRKAAENNPTGVAQPSLLSEPPPESAEPVDDADDEHADGPAAEPAADPGEDA